MRTLHHGACVNADFEAHKAAFFLEDYRIVVHPPVIEKYMVPLVQLAGEDVDILEPHPYLVRNRFIVDAAKVLRDVAFTGTRNPITDAQRAWITSSLIALRDISPDFGVLLATPEGPERVQSGTWSTIRYAMQSGVPVQICHPSGELEER